MNPPTAAEVEKVLEKATKMVEGHVTPEARELHYVVGGLEDSLTYSDYLVAIDQALVTEADASDAE